MPVLRAPPLFEKMGVQRTPFFLHRLFFLPPPPFFAALRTLTMCPNELIFYHKLPTIGTMFGTIFLFISWFVVCWIILLWNNEQLRDTQRSTLKAVIVYRLEIFVSLILSLYFQNFRRKLNSLDFIVCPSIQLFAYPSDVTVGFSCLNNFWRFF